MNTYLKLLMHPGVRAMSRLNYSWKFLVMGFLAFIACGTLMVNVVAIMHEHIAEITIEQHGIAMSRKMHVLLQQLQQYGNIATAASISKKNRQAEREQAKQLVFNAISQIDKSTEVHLLDTTQWQEFKKSWQEYLQKHGTEFADKNYSALYPVIHSAIRLYSDLIVRTNLKRDSDIQTAYLLDVGLLNLTNLAISLEGIRNSGHIAAYYKVIDHAELAKVMGAFDSFKKAQELLEEDVQQIIKQDPQHAKLFSAFLEQNMLNMKMLTPAIQDVIEQDFTLDSEVFCQRLNSGLNFLFRSADQVFIQSAQNLLSARKTDLKLKMLLFAGLPAFLLVWLVYLFASAYISIHSAVVQLAQGASAIAKGNLHHRIQLQTQDELAGVATSFNAMAEAIGELVRDLKETCSRLSGAAKNLTQSSQQIEAASHQQHRAASHMTATIQTMANELNNIASNASNARDLAVEAGTLSLGGTQIVNSTVKGMDKITQTVTSASDIIQSLGERSAQISQMTEVVKDIANQTNLLALNASIESARAGERGRGFAVVADEVRKLADRTAKATAEITEMVGWIQKNTINAVNSMSGGVSSVNEGMLLAHQTGEAMNSIRHGADSALQAVSHISNSIAEQKKASEQIALTAQQIAAMADQNDSLIKEAHRTAQQFEVVSSDLQAAILRFQV